MGLLNTLITKVFSKQVEPSPSNNQLEQAVIVRFDYGIDGLGALHDLEEKLELAITKKNVGEYDGHEIAMDYSDGFLYMYGPNAEILFQAVLPTLKETSFMKGATAKLRFGPAQEGVKEIEVEL